MININRIASLYLSEQFGRFLLSGGAALLLNWLSRFIFNLYFTFAWAIALAYTVGMLVAFVLNKIFVFPRSNRPVRFEISFFLFVNIAAFPVVWMVAHALGEWVFATWMPEQLAFAFGHGVAITMPVFLNFAIHKFITFREATVAIKSEQRNA